MQRLSLRYFYRLGAIIHPLTSLPADQRLIDIWSILHTADEALTALFASDNFIARSLKSSWDSGPELQAALKTLLASPDWNSVVGIMEIYPVRTAAQNFETMFTGELHFSDSYFVTQKGGLDTVRIITDGAVLFPADLPAKVPEALGDIREAGKCIAFELATAAGFHLLRANETVLRRYFDVVSGGHRRPNARNIAAYLKTMEKLQVGEPKVLAVLDQIRNLHRNTLIHPEDVLTVEEALSLLGIVRSAIAAMLKKIPMPTFSLSPSPAETVPSPTAEEQSS